MECPAIWIMFLAMPWGTHTSTKVHIGFSVSGPLVSEGDGGVSLNVVLTSGILQDVQNISFFTADDTAIGGVDYASTSGVLQFDENISEGSIFIELFDDDVLETLEKFYVIIEAEDSSAVTIQTSTSTVLIIDNDVGTIEPMQDSYTFAENDGTVQITFHFRGKLETNVSIIVFSDSQTAEYGSDYESVTEVITFTPTVLYNNVSLVIINDMIAEEEESLCIKQVIQGPPDDTIILDPDSITITITDDDRGIIGFDSSSVSVSEDIGEVTLTVVLKSGTFLGPQNISFSTEDGTAVGGFDYANTSGVLQFGENVTKVSFLIKIFDDNKLENKETFTVFIEAEDSSTVTFLIPAITVTIIDNDVGTVELVQDSYSFSENDGTVQISFYFNGQLERDVNVTVTSADQTAQAGLDYEPVSEVITFTPEQIYKLVCLVIIDDMFVEKEESLQITLSSDESVITLDPAFVTVTVTDDDVNKFFPAGGDERFNILVALSLCAHLQATGEDIPQFCSTLFNM